MSLPDRFEILIITLSDRASRGDYEDLSGPRIKEILSEYMSGLEWSYNISMSLIADDAPALRELIKTAGSNYNIIFTTGGTGIGPRDITIETIAPMLSKEIPGIMEFIRIKYGTVNPNALLSRGIAGITGKALVYTLPGSLKAVEEYMSEIVKTLEHTIMMQYGIDSHKKH